MFGGQSSFATVAQSYSIVKVNKWVSPVDKQHQSLIQQHIGNIDTSGPIYDQPCNKIIILHELCCLGDHDTLIVQLLTQHKSLRLTLSSLVTFGHARAGWASHFIQHTFTCLSLYGHQYSRLETVNQDYG